MSMTHQSGSRAAGLSRTCNPEYAELTWSCAVRLCLRCWPESCAVRLNLSCCPDLCAERLSSSCRPEFELFD